MGRFLPADQVDAGDDVAPLIAAAHLQADAKGPVEMEKIVGLQRLVRELGETDAVLGLHAATDRFPGQHLADPETPAHVAKEIKQVEGKEPIGVIHQHGGGGATAEIEESLELSADAGDIIPYPVHIEKIPFGAAAGGIADEPVPPPTSTTGRCPKS